MSTWGRLRFDANVAGADRIMRQLKPDERWCYVAGVLPIAAYSPLKGRLLIVDRLRADDHDIADLAQVSVRCVRRTLQKLRDAGVLLWDEDANCEYVAHAGYWDRASSGEDRWRRDRYARWASAPGYVSEQQIADRIAFYGGLCWICRVAPYEAMDHVKPLARGGSNWPANLRPACTPCNSRKGARWPYRRPS